MQIETLFKLSYGLYVVSSKGKNNKLNGFVSNAVFQVTADPVQISVACNKDNFTASCIDESGCFSVSILPEDTEADIFGTFGYQSGRDIEKFASKEHKIGETGAPILTENVVGYIECKVNKTVDVGTHMLYIADVVDAKVLNSVKPPMTYEYYHKVKKAASPKNAPTYIDPEKLQSIEEEQRLTKYQCSVCGYTLDVAKGDCAGHADVGQCFTSLPDDWVCPTCGVGKDKFVKL